MARGYMISHAAKAFVSIPAIVKLMKIAENSTDYINNTVLNILWLPASAEMKQKGKPKIKSPRIRIGAGIEVLAFLPVCIVKKF